MRNTIIVLILAGLFIGCATKLPPSQPSQHMMDQADTILLKVDESAENAFDGFSKHLSKHGFSFETRNESRRKLTTRMKRSKYFDFKYAVEMSVVKTDSATVIKVRGNAQNVDFGEIEPENWGIDQSLNMQAWAQIRQVAESYPHKELFYQRQ